MICRTFSALRFALLRTYLDTYFTWLNFYTGNDKTEAVKNTLSLINFNQEKVKLKEMAEAL